MNIILSPPSAHENSYFDVTFKIKFDSVVGKIKLNIFNDTSKEQLSILGVMGGYIVLEKTAIFDNTRIIEGFFNIFNNDKMNKKLEFYRTVDIRFVAEMEQDNEIKKIESTVIFYNESKSLDADIVPCDISLDNKVINIEQHIPMRFHIISDAEKTYELCIKGDGSSEKCSFLVAARKGKTSVEIPSEIIYSDLNLSNEKNLRRSYALYYIKREGMTYARLMNRRYVKISYTDLKFKVPSILMPLPQERYDPLGNQLSKDFVLSDRYLVHTHKEFSSLGKKSEFHPKRFDYLTRFFHEAQTMNLLDKPVYLFSENQPNGENTKELLRLENLKRQSRIKKVHTYSEDQRQLMNAFNASYEKQFSASVSTDMFYSLVTQQSNEKTTKTTTQTINAFGVIPAKSTGCLPCSRKKKIKT